MSLCQKRICFQNKSFSPYGYGKVIYIEHPNGITSVYTHCSKFKGKIDSITQITQKNEEKYKGNVELEIKIIDNCDNITEWKKNVVFE